MAEYTSITGNIYLWFFVSALFFGISIKLLTGRHLPGFYVALAFGIGALTLSVFFVDWQTVSWNYRMAVFYLVFSLFWFLTVRFPLFAGLPLVILFFGGAVLINYLVTDWCNISNRGDVAYIRELSESIREFSIEVTDCKGDILFFKRKSDNRTLKFKILEVPDSLFFVPGRIYLYPLDKGIPDRYNVLRFFSERIPLAELRDLDFTLPGMLLLKEYALALDNDRRVFKFRQVD